MPGEQARRAVGTRGRALSGVQSLWTGHPLARREKGAGIRGNLAIPREQPIRIGAQELGLSLAHLEPLLSRVFGAEQPCSSGRPCDAWRYLECPGQHPHRPSLHGLPLLEMRRAQLVPRHPRQDTARGSLGRPASERKAQGAWGATPPGAALGAGPQLQHSRLSQGSQEAAHSLLPAWKRKECPIFGEKRNSLFFPPKIPFPFRVRVWGHVFLKMYYFLLYSCEQKNNTWTKTLQKAFSRWTGFQKAHILGRKTCILASQTNRRGFAEPSQLPNQNWASVYPGSTGCLYLEGS